MSPQAIDLVQGTLEVLILKTLALEPMHGWGIGQRIPFVVFLTSPKSLTYN
jgi:DNA-binding PadR family transcriptional regulator